MVAMTIVRATASAALILLQSSTPAPDKAPGAIAGVVVNERHEPAAGATVLAFPARAQTGRDERAPLTTLPTGSTSTDSQGRFRIAGLPLGEYLVAARVRPSPESGASKQTPMSAATFYPSAIDHQAAVSVPA